jgi:hypothetical protein
VARSLRPMLHRITANTINMVAASSQEAIVERMGRDFTIRNKSHKGRFPSFIQNQVKITKWAYAKNFPNIDAEISVTPQPSESNREGTPLILDILESGGRRTPFIGKHLGIPMTENTRQGGAWAGKVMRRFQFDRMDLHPVTISPKREKYKDGRKRNGREYKRDQIYKKIAGRKGSGIFSKYRDGRLTLWQRVKSTGEERHIYSLWKTSSRQKKLFHFYDEAKLGLYFAQDHFDALLEEYGVLTSKLIARFKWQRFDFGKDK